MTTQLRDKALAEYGCTEFIAVTEGDEEVALSYWESEEDIARWKRDIDHQVAQQLGLEHWYQNIRVEIAKIGRSYSKRST